MFRDAFSKYDRLETEDLLNTLNPVLDGTPFDPETSVVMGMDLSFYPGYRLIEIAHHATMPARKLHILYKTGGKPVILDWTNAPIYALNKTVPLALDDHNITDYVRFFMAYVRGRHARFLIVESVDDIAWKDEPPATLRKVLGGLIEPLRITGTTPDGGISLDARMIFKDSLFKGVITVKTDGEITLTGEELLVEEIPVLDDVLSQ